MEGVVINQAGDSSCSRSDRRSAGRIEVPACKPIPIEAAA